MKHPFVDIHTHHPTEALTISFVGIHPWDAAHATAPSEAEYVAADAVGEIGLDFACGVDCKAQRNLLDKELTRAERLAKPVVLHCVKAFECLMRELKGRKLQAVIFHGFIGSKEQAAKALERGCYLSFGARTESSPKTLEALRTTPLERLFVESDESTRPIEELYATIARLRGVTIEELQAATLRNYKRIFCKNNE